MHEYVFITGGAEVCPHFDYDLNRIMFTAPDADGKYPNEFHTDDYSLITNSDSVSIADTEVKDQYVGEDSLIQGEIDMTGIYGELYYKMRSGTINFISQQYNNQDIGVELINRLSGRTVKIIQKESPLYYYEGRILKAIRKVGDYWTTFSFNYKLYPFKKRVYSNLNLHMEYAFQRHDRVEVEGLGYPIYRPLWDLIDFEADYVVPDSYRTSFWHNGAIGAGDKNPDLEYNNPRMQFNALYAVIANNSPFTIVPEVTVIRGADYENSQATNPETYTPDTGYLLLRRIWKDDKFSTIRDNADLTLAFVPKPESHRNFKNPVYIDREHVLSSKGYTGKYLAWTLACPPAHITNIGLVTRYKDGAYGSDGIGVVLSVRQVEI